jgi:thymidine phosphorylase
MAYSGDKLNWGSKIVVDKHCVGGIPGNRTTPLVVSICAAAGLTMPKTSSRAITSAAGTADSMEVLTEVSLPTNKLRKIVKETGACLAWGGALGLAPADDLLIHVERKLNLDPMPQIVASILSKKLAAGSTHVLIDIPMGKGAKVSNTEGRKLAKMFSLIGSKFNLKLKTVFTDGTKPVGQGVGPVLEIRDVLSVLKQEKNISDLESKAIFLSGEILELSGKARKGQGAKMASEILKSGSAFMKFKEIISAQGEVANPNLIPGPLSFKIKSNKNGKLVWHNQEINNLAKALGCPEHKRAGVFLDLPHFSKVKKGQVLCTLYAQNNSALKEGLSFIKSKKIFDIL